MNEAHSSVDRERTILEENRKLKQENVELRTKYEKETLENKIKNLEMTNEIQTLQHQMEITKLQSQQERNEAVSSSESALKEENLRLKEENGSLKHQIEITNIKMQQNGQNNLDDEKVKEIDSLKNEIKYLKDQFQALEKATSKGDLEKNVLALGEEIDRLKTQSNDTIKQIQTQKNQSDAAFQTLRKECEDLKLHLNILDQSRNDDGDVKKEVQTLRNEFGIFNANIERKLSLVKIPGRFFEGAERFWMNYNTGRGDFSGEDYKLWYEDMSRSMENRKQYANEKFVLIRKESKIIGNSNLYFASKQKGVEHSEAVNYLIIEGLYEKTTADANVFLLHPSDYRKFLKMKFFNTSTYIRWWYSGENTKDFSFGNTSSVIMLAEFK